MKTRKGITPIIAIIILLLITIALAGAAWAYLNQLLLGQISKTFQTAPGQVFCENGIINVWATNTGYDSTLIDEDFLIVTVDGVDNRTSLKNFALKGGNATLVFQSNCGDDDDDICDPGYHTIRLGTSSTVINPMVTC